MKERFPYYSIGHFLNQPNNPTEFEITRFETMEDPDVEDPHKHTFYEILWFDEGESTQVIDYQEFKTGPGALLFISPGQLHHFEAWQELKGGSIFFTEAFFLLHLQDRERLLELTFLDNFYTQPLLWPNADHAPGIRQTIEALLHERARPDYSEGIARTLLHLLVAQIQRCFDAQQTSKAPRKYVIVYKNFKNLLDAQFDQALTASDYARQLHLTPHHLNLILRQVTGKTTSELIRHRSVLEAKRLLTFSDLPVSEIAASLGYFDLSYFAKVFKLETGVAPLAFRGSMSEKYRKRPVLF